MDGGFPAPASLCGAGCVALCQGDGSARAIPVRLDAVITLGSPEAASCRLTVTNMAPSCVLVDVNYSAAPKKNAP